MMKILEMDNADMRLAEDAVMRPVSVAATTDAETHVYFESCEDAKTVTLPDSTVEGTGRMLDVSMTLRSVCPGKRTAVGVALTEVDSAGNEHARGFRAVTVPAHSHADCCDIVMPSIRFILPEDIRVDGGTGLCSGRRHFVLRSSNHYVDTVTPR